jgi:hypothetical protein
VTVKGEDEQGNFRNAMAQAEHFCKQWDKAPVVEKEGSKYVGEMSEANYKAMKSISKAGHRVGGAVFMGGSKDAYAKSRTVHTGAGVLSDMAGDGYVTRMNFRCQ